MNSKSLSNNPKYRLSLQPIGRKIEITPDQHVLEAARLNGVEIIALCGGMGACDSCKIRILSGEVSGPTLIENEVFSDEELNNGYRLACQIYPKSDLMIAVPPESLSAPQRLQIEGREIDIKPSPIVKRIDIQLSKPSLSDLRSDAQRITDEITSRTNVPDIQIDYGTLKHAASILRENNWSVGAVLHGNNIIGILPPASPLFGIAVDIGTTKLAAYLVDLDQGSIVARAGCMNPQISYGEDVISRVSYAMTEPRGEHLLQKILIETINNLVDDLTLNVLDSDTPVERDHIVDAVVVGNSAMHHIFLGLPVDQLGNSPYVPTQSESMRVPARELGLNIGHGTYVYLPPLISGYIGADHTAMLLSTQSYDLDETCVALDIGTNTEISLAHKGKLLSCSCASGPAFEGAHIQSGMRAAQGAIERIRFEGDNILYYTIGDIPPIGICGSGILDTIAEMLNAGFLDRRGNILDGSERILRSGGEQSFRLVDNKSSGHGKSIYINRKDIIEIQLAKGAIRSGIEILLREAELSASQIQRFIIAGAFGTYLNIDSAVRIGMFPPIPGAKYDQVGNAAGAGAVLLLLSKAHRKIAEQIAHKIKYIELANHPLFTNEFAKALFFENPR